VPPLVVALLVGCARVAAGVHWPRDSIGSALVALALGALALPLTRMALARTPLPLKRLAGVERCTTAGMPQR